MRARAILLLTWILNPIQFCLSFTFMTEVPFLFFIMLGTFLYLRWLVRGNPWLLAASAASFGYAYLIRQTALLFVAAMIFSLAFLPDRSAPRARIARIASCTAMAGAFVAAYHCWVTFLASVTPALQRKFDLLRLITTEQLAGNFFGLLFYVAFMLLPLSAWMLPALPRLFRTAGPAKSLIAGGFWGALALGGSWWFYSGYSATTYLPARSFHGRMPYLLNVLYDTGLGPLTLDPTYYGAPPTPTYPTLWLAVTVLTAASLVVLGSACSLSHSRIWQGGGGPLRQGLILFSLASFLAVLTFEVVFSHRQEGGLFDRHVLAAALPALLLAALAATQGLPASGSPAVGANLRPHARLAGFLAAASCFLMLAVLAWFCVAATHDYLAWNRLRWRLGKGLLAEGTDPLLLSGGFEFNAWHNYDTFRARGNIRKVYYWWYDEPKYVIAMEPQERFRAMRSLDYFSWLHRRSFSVYLLAALPGNTGPR
jgi:hypothetical protein